MGLTFLNSKWSAFERRSLEITHTVPFKDKNCPLGSEGLMDDMKLRFLSSRRHHEDLEGFQAASQSTPGNNRESIDWLIDWWRFLVWQFGSFYLFKFQYLIFFCIKNIF